ncbi:NUDIX hydrolase [[Clostridium] scindens]|nr:NUDIX hydrolase [[Clostridium] scindens]NSJ05158.1 NUDIX hydrolase [[Clostridium] scindens]QRO38896.1 NUDIX hydrolase [[Clostridium] scindens]
MFKCISEEFRGNHPSIGLWALPGGFIDLRENLEDTAMRELEEETGVKGVVMEQIANYGDYERVRRKP